MLEFSNAAVTAPRSRSCSKRSSPFADVAAKERTASDTLRASVEEVEKLLSHGKAQKRTVARALGMSRRLAVEETPAYEEVVDTLRRSLALQYLKEPGMSLSQIAWLLGYEGLTSFHHVSSDGRRLAVGSTKRENAFCISLRPAKNGLRLAQRPAITGPPVSAHRTR